MSTAHLSHTEQQHRSERAIRTAELLDRAYHCDEAERQELIAQVVEANMGVAEAVASRFRHRGVAEEDLRQVAYLALTKAARHFDPEAGFDFLSYAVPTMRGELRRYFRDSGWMVRPPRKVQELQGRIFGAQFELSAVLGRSPSPSEVAAHLQVPLEELEEALAAEGCFTPASLDKTMGNKTSETTVGDFLGGVDEGTQAVEARVVLAPVVRRLSERDRKVLRMRFFDDLTQREIAQEIGVTQTQVSRVLGRIMRELREGVQDSAHAAAELAGPARRTDARSSLAPSARRSGATFSTGRATASR
jgi:RNA polymerase sigma-B factor